jgi:hypothetical protein
MTFSIHQLDNLDYDDAEPLLDDYISGALETFVESAAGRKHCKRYPEGGNWIGTFIEMAFLYGGYTLSKMTKGNVQEVMEDILPRKLTLLDPSETNGAIDELVAFWTFLGEEYRLRNAKGITKYLSSIANQFPQWMFDPERGGIAKNFMMQGLAAGFDMTTQKGLEAFQQEYNDQLASQRSPLSGMPGMPGPTGMPGMPGLPGMPVSPMETMTPPPPEVQAAFAQLGLELPKVGEPVNVMALMAQFMAALAERDPDMAEAFMASLEADLDEEDSHLPAPGGTLEDVRVSLLKNSLEQVELVVTETEEALLREQTITATTPGTIVQDFETTLAFVGDGMPVSGKLHHLSLKLLGDLNQRLSHPIAIELKRPQQKSYPNIHGLYLLLRATGIADIVVKGKQAKLVLNAEVHGSWQQLNPTEKYFTLLEAWMLRGHPQMLGEERSGPFAMGDRCLKVWPQLSHSRSHTFKDYTQQETYTYWPGFYNLLLMEMFGMVTITHGKPDKGKGWRMEKLEVLPWGDALMKVLYSLYMSSGFTWQSAIDPTQAFGELQPMLQSYFPEWQNNLATVSFDFRPGRHIFKVSLDKTIWRRIAMPGDATLEQFGCLITNSVDFDRDHLDQFTYSLPNGRTVEATHPWADGDLSTDEVKIGELPLREGSTMEYLFDFGDCWQFDVVLETIEPEVEPEPEPQQGFQKVKQTKKRKSPKKHTPSGEILEVHGEAPEQYPGYDEDW